MAGAPARRRSGDPAVPPVGPALPKGDLRALSIFAALYTELQVTRAAQKLGVTQSAVSHSLKALRQRFDDPLFERGAAQLRPTRLARTLAPHILPAVQAAEAVFEHCPGSLEAPRSRMLSIGMTPGSRAALLPGLCRALATGKHQAPMRIASIRSDADALEAVDRRSLDLAVGDFGAAVPSRLRQTLLYQDAFVTLAWLGNKRLPARTLPLDAFLDLPHLRVADDDDGTGDAVDELLAARGLRRRVEVIAPSFLQAPELLVGTSLLVTMPSSVARARTDLAEQLRFFKPPLALRKVEVVAVTHARSATDPLMQAAWQALLRLGREVAAASRGPGQHKVRAAHP
ncbi:MAG: LysR family transcriptional regulator [Proteobacteria bacterium]|nr:LysR family transcriptional regulator [Pseudomonadota bacterium]